MAFVLGSLPYGIATAIYYPLIGGKPVNIISGWVEVSLIVSCVPTAGILSSHPSLWVYLRFLKVSYQVAQFKSTQLSLWVNAADMVSNHRCLLPVSYGIASEVATNRELDLPMALSCWESYYWWRCQFRNEHVHYLVDQQIL